jgi:hypothetical protein
MKMLQKFTIFLTKIEKEFNFPKKYLFFSGRNNIVYKKNSIMIATISKIFRIIADSLTKIIEFMIRKIVLLTVVFFVSTSMIADNNHALIYETLPVFKELLYDNVWGSIYHADTAQCDSTPTITGDGSRINPYHASEHRWIAISQDMLNSIYRAQLLKNPNTDRFKGKIQYGDTIWIESPHETINGWWVVRDAKNVMYNNSIDFLQTAGDGSLYENSPYWSGKFDSIKIYQIKNYKYLSLQKNT